MTCQSCWATTSVFSVTAIPGFMLPRDPDTFHTVMYRGLKFGRKRTLVYYNTLSWGLGIGREKIGSCILSAALFLAAIIICIQE